MSSQPRRSKNKRSSAVRPEEPADPRGERLQKVLAAAGVASRRECEQMILEGRIDVDGQVVMQLGTRVDPHNQQIRIDGTALPRPRLQYFALNKPTGVVTTANDPWARPRVTDLVPENAGRVFAVGRLDMASEGLVLLTNDGELANRITHPRYGVEKTYHVQVAGEVQPELLDKLRQGVWIAEGRVRVEQVHIHSHHKKSTILQMVLREGKNREIRRMLAALGHKVQKLRRVAIGPLKLGSLPLGEYRPLLGEEVRELIAAAARSPKERGAGDSNENASGNSAVVMQRPHKPRGKVIGSASGPKKAYARAGQQRTRPARPGGSGRTGDGKRPLSRPQVGKSKFARRGENRQAGGRGRGQDRAR